MERAGTVPTLSTLITEVDDTSEVATMLQVFFFIFETTISDFDDDILQQSLHKEELKLWLKDSRMRNKTQKEGKHSI